MTFETPKLYAWKRIADGEIAQGQWAPSADDLFEAAGFGAVDTDKPLRGYLAVPVHWVGRILVEEPPESSPAKGA
jgi:hypothetical protein